MAPFCVCVANNTNAGQSGTAVGLGLVPTLNLAPPHHFPEARMERKGRIGYGHSERETTMLKPEREIDCCSISGLRPLGKV